MAFPVNHLLHRSILAWSSAVAGAGGAAAGAAQWAAVEWMAARPEVSCQAVLNLFHWEAHFPKVAGREGERGGEADSRGQPPLTAGQRALRVLELLVSRGGARLDVLCPHDLQAGRLSIARFILRARLHECYALVLAEGGPGLMALHAQVRKDPARTSQPRVAAPRTHPCAGGSQSSPAE